MNYNVYIDESGNTGNIEIHENLEWNYEKQTHFALGAIYIEECISNAIEEKMVEILHTYDTKLGTEKELKSKAKYVFRNDLLKEITKVLLENHANFSFDISNKKYKVIMSLVEYCVYPYYMYDKRLDRNLKIDAVNYLYKTLPIETIKRYIDLCQKEHNEESVEELIEYLCILEKHYISNGQKNNPVASVLEVVKNYKKAGLMVKNLFPIKDYNNKGTEESFLPNVDAYTNMIAALCKLKINRNDTISIFHDDQKQFSDVLKSWTVFLHSNNLNINQIKFVNSKKSILVQIVDFYTGNIVKLYRKIIDFENLDRQDRELLNILKPVLEKINFVAPKTETHEFFKQCCLRQVRSPILF